MGSLVGTEVGAVTKTFSTVRTLVGLLTRVGSLVGYAVEVPSEAFYACVTGVGFLCEVQASMVDQLF